MPLSKFSRYRGWITPLVGRAVSLLTIPGTLVHGSRQDAQLQAADAAFHDRRAMRVDNYVAVWLVLETACFLLLVVLKGFDESRPVLSLTGKLVLVTLVLVRVLEIPAHAIRMSLFDAGMVPAGKSPIVASRARIIVLGIVNYLELFVCFALFYLAGAGLISGTDDDPNWLRALHLSAATQLTIGYGDVSPKSWLRPIAWFHGLISLLLILILLGRFASMLRPDRSLHPAEDPATTERPSGEDCKSGSDPNVIPTPQKV